MDITMEQLLERLEKLEAENKKLKGARGSSKRATSPAPVTTVEIGCNLISGVRISSPSNDVDIFINRGEIVTLSSADVMQILKGSNNRTMFVNGLLYFTDEAVYESFGIRRKYNINSDVIKELVEKNDVSGLESFFREVTKNKIDTDMVHTVFYTIVILNIDGELNGMRYETRKFIEKYFFGMEIEMAGKLYLALKDIQR